MIQKYTFLAFYRRVRPLFAGRPFHLVRVTDSHYQFQGCVCRRPWTGAKKSKSSQTPSTGGAHYNLNFYISSTTLKISFVAQRILQPVKSD